MRVIERDDDDYPAALEALEAPPPRLFVRGPLDLDRPRVAVVGTRRPSARGRRLATQLGRGLAEAGVVVVSGGALGVDGAAHRGALDAGGLTWVVLPSPIARPVPATHRRLFQEVLEAGVAWLSELEEETGKQAFYMRNRVVAALGAALVVVEAQEASGTAHSVAFARELGRPVAVYPWAVGDPSGAGCLRWLKEGAHLVTGPEDVLELVGHAPAPSPPGSPSALVAALGAGRTAEEAAALVGLEVHEVLSELTRLELEGRVCALPGGRFAAER